jgi:hypothetical protein
LNHGLVIVNFHDGSAPFRTPLAGLTGLVVYGRGDHEHIRVAANLLLPAILFAGDGSDTRIDGGGGPTVEVGGTGDSTLKAGKGRDILIAGKGEAHLIGNVGGDILIGGWTDYDHNVAVLQAILAEWSSADTYAARTAALASYFNTATVHDNGHSDHLQGGGGRDWVFALLGGPHKDRLSHFALDDTVVGIH